MRAGLAKNEPKRLEKWQQMDLYHKMLDANKDNAPYVLHDGPPYANGPIHMGHAFNKILKDIINKYKTMRGFYTPYVPGWDCHGQPIEHIVEENLGPVKWPKTDQPTRRRLCREWAEKHVDLQREGFKRLGITGEWDDPYLTFVPSYEAGIVRVFKDLYESGAIYRGRKPIHWCWHDHTALAEAELEYSDEVSPSIYVAFKLVDGAGEAANVNNEVAAPQSGNVSVFTKPGCGASTFASALSAAAPKMDLCVLIWTTTPWTMPANVAVTLKPDADYVCMLYKDKAMILAQALVGEVAQAIGIVDDASDTDAVTAAVELLKDANGNVVTVKGSDLVGTKYEHPVHNDMQGVIITGAHVTLDSGTGCVHTAPGHGQEDYEMGIEYKLPML
ncbi:MAG: class I tRNA ligase family protein, partial [Coriobacteriales bacterium]|nr:class I tRNA ligase family protein [Coriobacteriales bacterium]